MLMKSLHILQNTNQELIAYLFNLYREQLWKCRSRRKFCHTVHNTKRTLWKRSFTGTSRWFTTRKGLL